MVIDEHVASDSVEQVNAVEDILIVNPLHDHLHDVIVPQVEEDLPLEDNALVVVPYQPPVIQHAEIVIGMARVVYGPVLPPEMIWKRAFDSMLQFGTAMEVPRLVSLP